ncbi:OmpA family protein [Pseudooceanicola sp. CBS1P-1]|uniref:OmpA family protein n=1 Tax=Pseudooceanicola albus TaxID=2692189 RepID=A0A6L7G463_9RHOB|nr:MULTISPECIES: OmpA family protein [Pseudooceanicola]MBT9384607.1 OmpA family protein [Pseudooceanicola endophyticus]MXN18308.1 OmpA family protein [Pseudooceanicola albus]
MPAASILRRAGAALALFLWLCAAPAWAASQAQEGQIQGSGWNEPYVPGVWIDPDGCEHWVMDDGAEGYMSPHVTPDGRPVCHQPQICGIVPTDQAFATDRFDIAPASRQRLEAFFRARGTNTFLIEGHTDSRASDAHNQRLSEARARAVADIAESVGARITAVRGFGESRPAKPNTSAANMAANRRVEIICLH